MSLIQNIKARLKPPRQQISISDPAAAEKIADSLGLSGRFTG